MIDRNTLEMIILKEIQEKSVPNPERTELEEDQPLHELVVTPDPQHSGRIVRPPNKFTLLGECYEAISEEHEQDPYNYDEAINENDQGCWQDAMKGEIESMYSNQVCKLVDLPANIKPIGCKCVYKRKRGPDRRVETFQVRLIAIGYTQKEGIDYEETFLPVAMLQSIRILLFIAAHLDYKAQQMDVKTVFLNGHHEEDIYMMQPNGFVAKNEEQRVY